MGSAISNNFLGPLKIKSTKNCLFVYFTESKSSHNLKTKVRDAHQVKVKRDDCRPEKKNMQCEGFDFLAYSM